MQIGFPPELEQFYGQDDSLNRRLEQYTFSHAFESVLTLAESSFTFNIGAEASFILTHTAIWTDQTVSSQAMAAVSYKWESSASGRQHQNEFVLAINFHGTIGMPYEVVPTLYEASSNFSVTVRNDSASTADIDVGFMGYRVYGS